MEQDHMPVYSELQNNTMYVQDVSKQTIEGRTLVLLVPGVPKPIMFNVYGISVNGNEVIAVDRMGNFVVSFSGNVQWMLVDNSRVYFETTEQTVRGIQEYQKQYRQLIEELQISDINPSDFGELNE